ncbi:hypothetical protein Tco_1415891 [Tanacetum coccineum]
MRRMLLVLAKSRVFRVNIRHNKHIVSFPGADLKYTKDLVMNVLTLTLYWVGASAGFGRFPSTSAVLKASTPLVESAMAIGSSTC